MEAAAKAEQTASPVGSRNEFSKQLDGFVGCVERFAAQKFAHPTQEEYNVDPNSRTFSATLAGQGPADGAQYPEHLRHSSDTRHSDAADVRQTNPKPSPAESGGLVVSFSRGRYEARWYVPEHALRIVPDRTKRCHCIGRYLDEMTARQEREKFISNMVGGNAAQNILMYGRCFLSGSYALTRKTSALWNSQHGGRAAWRSKSVTKGTIKQFPRSVRTPEGGWRGETDSKRTEGGAAQPEHYTGPRRALPFPR
eukprot:2028729-Rhodomonas_salina.3